MGQRLPGHYNALPIHGGRDLLGAERRVIVYQHILRKQHMDGYLQPLLWTSAGLGLLVVGGELLVRGAVGVSLAVRVSPLVIGLTVVAFGTSAPELAVSVRAALAGSPELAIGNVVGSNIANILLILGAAALISPLAVSSQIIRFDVPLMIAASCALLAVGWDGRISRLDGAVLVCALAAYTGWSWRQSRRENQAVQQEFSQHLGPARQATVTRLLGHAALILVGLALLAGGARWLVDGAVEIARLWGMSELVIGLTVVAVGTSLPEVVTSLVASFRGERDIAVGNVVGSNLFNILCVLGISSLVASQGIRVSAAALQFDIPIMIAVAVACLPIFFTGRTIARWEGALFLGYYAAYTTYLVLAATQASVTRTFGSIMLGFVIPLTVLTLLICVVRAVRQQRAAGPMS
jgi:cation:H+ antiporter